MGTRNKGGEMEEREIKMRDKGWEKRWEIDQINHENTRGC